MEITKNENEQKGNDNNKVNKAFESNLKKLVAIVDGEKNLKPVTKVGSDIMKNIVTELFKEETEAIEQSTKDTLKELLKKYVQMLRDIDAKKKELSALEIAKKKEFNEAATKLFNKIDGIGILESEYYGALVTAVSAETNEEEDADEE
jgi:hypothetical protein